ncbi:alpha/beta hydrolase [Streptomyces sp. KAI-26]|uniref:alpha/beta fold hydrolase n=1 Tax=Streptomyces TaxID=1883 RepID=UPI0015872381|nr:alpha/beta hydrolase [Streptomyces sp. KAI-26]NUV84978.1 alpha/beta hydrolase [Streptomyces sp. KAI-26]NUW18965.1 alpha/beta hydrolase [Streptomyces roseoviolaceus]
MTTTDRTAPRTGLLTVDGATLHHEVRGEGPLLVMMPGGSADAGIYDAIAADLADRWTVATFDPRGYSRSPLDGPVTEQLPATHADDIVRLIEVLSPDGAPAALFGSSSSAVVALDVLARHPGRVSRVVAHEPPVVGLLPDPEAGRALFAAVRESFRRDGVAAAMTTMAEGLAPAWGEDRADPEPTAFEAEADAEPTARDPESIAPEPAAMAPEPERAAPEPAAPASSPQEKSQETPPEMPPAQAEVFRRMHANLPVFLEHVLCSFSGYAPDLAALKASAAHLVVGVGRDSRTLLPAVAAEALARRVDARVAEFPGGHIGLTEDPRAFAARLRDVLLAP